MSFAIAAPYPTLKVTTILPNPKSGDTRGVQSGVQLKRTMTGKVWTYVTSNTKENLSFVFDITRQKDLELAELIRVYHTAFFKLTDHNGVAWKAQLVGEPIRRVATARINDNTASTGGESLEVTLNFSAEKL